ncbi:MAG TPA: Uma2 family endonuclease [Humisphaera sp.]|jgi:Uma2 family endonuclease|nr:Uma2 family endonuclease [Humisphaera sp.]
MPATIAIPLEEQQHFVMDGVSWGFYEHVLEEAGDRPIRITYLNGSIEMMAPLAEHEWAKKAIARLLEALTSELDIPMRAFGSATFRREDRQAGLEPDECYYLRNEEAVAGMNRFDAAIHPPPDLAVEVDITSRSIAREPVYAALGVQELWRFDGHHLSVLILKIDGLYAAVAKSPSFPFIPLAEFEQFVKRMAVEEQTRIVREFRKWVVSLPRA